MAGRKFTASTTADRDKPNYPFELDGVYARGETPNGSDGTWHLEFEAMGSPPLGAVEVLNSAQIYDDRTGRTVWNPAAVVGFLAAVLTPDSATRFHALVNDRRKLVDLNELANVLTWLSEEYTGGPTGAPSSSSTGGAATGDGASGSSPAMAPVFPPPPRTQVDIPSPPQAPLTLPQQPGQQ